MAEYTSSALSILTTFFASEDIEHTARRIDFVKRASPIIGKLFHTRHCELMSGSV